jgi:hypothetical protein
VPAFETLPRFTTDLQHLTPAQRHRFHHAVLNAFVPDLRTGLFRPACASRACARAAWPGADDDAAELPLMLT